MSGAFVQVQVVKRIMATALLNGKHWIRQAMSYSIATGSVLLNACEPRHFSSVYFDINPLTEAYEGHGERQYVYLIYSLVETGFVVFRPRDAYLLFKILPLPLFMRSVRFSLCPQQSQLMISESIGRGETSSLLKIEKSYYTEHHGPDVFYMPYFAHPRFYMKRVYLKVSQLRQRPRLHTILFAGNVTPNFYTSKFNFPILNRIQIMDFVVKNFNPQIVKSEIKLFLTDADKDLRVGNSHINYLSDEDYLENLSRADFFICPPGHLMPHAHNLIEAMSVGTIPITNYHEYTHPRLIPNYNCLAFSDLDELHLGIERALSMGDQEIAMMRHNVIRYYDDFVDPRQFGKQLRANMATIRTLVVNDETGR